MNTFQKTNLRFGNVVPRPVTATVITFLPVYGSAAQTKGSQPGQQPSPTAVGRAPGVVLVSPEEDYRIGPNDVLEVKVENAPELSQTYRVTAAGTFLMPYIGRVQAAKRTTEQLAQFIADGLRGDYLKDPKVVVWVKEYNSRSFYIQGQVRSGGVFQIEGRPSMLELITLAGGLTEKHGTHAYIMRKIKVPEQKLAEPTTAKGGVDRPGSGQEPTLEEAPKYELKSTNINALLKGQFQYDVQLEPGDIINIPPTDLFFVAGEVNAPGSFDLKEGTTLRQAISLAQGTNYKAALNRGIVFRENPTGKREELHVEIGAIMQGKKEDIAIMANDIIMVPNSRAKSIGGAIMRTFGLSTVTRLPLP